jgi:hypothetical protein
MNRFEGVRPLEEQLAVWGELAVGNFWASAHSVLNIAVTAHCSFMGLIKPSGPTRSFGRAFVCLTRSSSPAADPGSLSTPSSPSAPRAVAAGAGFGRRDCVLR